MLPYEKLDAWRLGHELVLLTYRVTARFPADERFGLTRQMRRAAFSVAANIAEGSAKKGSREFRRYLSIAIGSLAELAYCFRLAHDLGYFSTEARDRIEALRARVGLVTWSLYQGLANR